MARTLTKKQRGFVKDYLETGNGSLAAKRNYEVKNDTTAAVIASENLIKPNIVRVLDEVLSEDKLAEVHRGLLEQNRIDYFVFPKYMEDEEIVEHVEDATGIKVLNVRETEKGKMAFYVTSDAMARSKALEMGYKIKGTFAPEKKLNLNVNRTENPRLDDLIAKIEHDLDSGT